MAMDGAADFSILPAKAIGTMTIDNFEGCANKCRCCKSAVYLLFLFAAFFCERTGIERLRQQSVAKVDRDKRERVDV